MQIFSTSCSAAFNDRQKVNFPFDQTQPVGFGKPATLQAPLAGPLGNI